MRRRTHSGLCAVLAGLACSAGGHEPAGPAAEHAAARPSAAVPPVRGPALPFEALPQRLQPRNVTRTGERNEAYPRFSPEGRYLGFESRDGSAQAIWLARVDELSAAPQRVSSAPVAAVRDEDALLGLRGRDESFNTQLAFVPGEEGFVFTGNGQSGSYRLFRGRIGASQAPLALTADSKQDGHPAVSPDGRWLVYVSARESAGKLMLRELASGEERQLTHGPDVDLYPAWSPDSRSIAFTSGSNDDHNVFLLRDVTTLQGQAPEPIALTRWSFDDLRPVFSPDGSALAFYSNADPSGDLREWSIAVVPADGSGPVKGKALADLVIARHVVKDIDAGPAWLPWGRQLVYARNLKEEWNPIYAVDVDTRAERRIETGTRMNHDLTCSAQGMLAFRAQVASWDDIFVASLVGEKAAEGKP